jgi:hypothetical protein
MFDTPPPSGITSGGDPLIISTISSSSGVTPAVCPAGNHR